MNRYETNLSEKHLVRRLGGSWSGGGRGGLWSIEFWTQRRNAWRTDGHASRRCSEFRQCRTFPAGQFPSSIYPFIL